MSRTFRSLGLAIVSAVVMAGAPALAATSAGKGSPAAQTKAASSMKSSKASNDSHSLKGTLEKFDSSSRMLTIHTSKGAETLTLDTNAHIMQGSKAVTADDLASHTGSRVDVRYTESNGQKTAQNVRLMAASQSAAKSKKPGHNE